MLEQGGARWEISAFQLEPGRDGLEQQWAISRTAIVAIIEKKENGTADGVL